MARTPTDAQLRFLKRVRGEGTVTLHYDRITGKYAQAGVKAPTLTMCVQEGWVRDISAGTERHRRIYALTEKGLKALQEAEAD